jgi:calcium permeable stress-gated cation channel
LRPKWSTLYHARKEQSNAALRLPELPNTFFGWIPVVIGISKEEVLASAGLDAYAFLAFYRYAIKFLAIIMFFSLSVILPVNSRYTGDALFPGLERGNSTDGNRTLSYFTLAPEDDTKKPKMQKDTSYLWMYTVFAWFFTSAAIYLLIRETKHIIRIRQAYLGTQATVTDRTIRLSGIPEDMRSEDKIRDFIEELGIGKVDSVMLCKNWQKLDDTMAQRMQYLRQLEKAWTTYLGHHHSIRHTRHRHRRPDENGNRVEGTALLSESEMESAHASAVDRDRPKHTIRYGFLNLKSKKVDAIDYFQEKLRRVDERIKVLRKEDFKPTPLAFVTMESTASCQMAIQAILDPNPGTFIANLAPPPVDVVWKNTYLSRNARMWRSWSIMIAIGFLTVFWTALLVPLAGLLSIEVIDKILPGLADVLEAHDITRSLISSGLPTLAFSLLSIGVAYLYDWLANQQGMTSQGDIDLSVISKNFFFVFFNLFIVFTLFGTASTFFEFWQDFKEIIRDTGLIANTIAKSLESLSPFYTNLIVLQGLGLFPFRLLEFGTVSLYPFYLISAATPRDYAELSAAPVFNYGFFLPQSMLIFVICTVYSVLPASWTIVIFGLIYFIIGHFIYKYQLLYAMEHRQQSTGRAWPMICSRIILGLVFFQIALTGILALKGAFTASLFVVPLIAGTIWFTVYFQRAYYPLMWFIALRSIDKPLPPPMVTPPESVWDRDTDRGRAIDETEETGLRYVNPNLVTPLETMWVRKPANHHGAGGDDVESGVA